MKAVTGKTGGMDEGEEVCTVVGDAPQAPLALPLTEFARIQWLREVRVRIRRYMNLS